VKAPKAAPKLERRQHIDGNERPTKRVRTSTTVREANIRCKGESSRRRAADDHLRLSPFSRTSKELQELDVDSFATPMDTKVDKWRVPEDFFEGVSLPVSSVPPPPSPQHSRPAHRTRSRLRSALRRPGQPRRGISARCAEPPSSPTMPGAFIDHVSRDIPAHEPAPVWVQCAAVGAVVATIFLSGPDAFKEELERGRQVKFEE
jgi:hypothetical protein